MHTCTRADFFCGVYQLETRFARIISNTASPILSAGLVIGVLPGMRCGHHEMERKPCFGPPANSELFLSCMDQHAASLDLTRSFYPPVGVRHVCLEFGTACHHGNTTRFIHFHLGKNKDFRVFTRRYDPGVPRC